MVLESQQIKVTLLSLGCNKNLVDSEVMLGLLEREGYLLWRSGRSRCINCQYLWLY